MKEKLNKILTIVIETVKANKSIFMKILAVIIIVIALIVIGSSFKGTKYGNSSGNSQNMGLAAQGNNWIYFIEYDDDEPIGISKVKENGKKVEKVVEGYFLELNIIDNYIYCIEYNEDAYRYDLVKMKTNGKNKTTLARDIDKGTVTATDKWVYYFKTNNFYRVKTDGTERVRISDRDISYYTIDGNWIYYIYETDNSQAYIAKMKLDGDKVERISKAQSDENYESIYIKGSKIYYIVSTLDENYEYEYSIYKMNKSGSKSEKVCRIEQNENVATINMQEDGIYYTITENYDDYEIKYIKYNGTDKQTITEMLGVKTINITDKWIFVASQDENYDTSIKMINKNGEKEKEL